MKKLISVLLTLTLVLGMGIVGSSAQASEGLKLGLNIDTSIAKSKDATADAEGLAQADSVAVAVLVDAEGKLVNVYIDTAQVKMPFTAEGKLSDSFPTEVKTKLELGTAYGMSAVSSIGADWDAQIAAFGAYIIGKTADEIAGIAVDESTKPTDADLTAGCTMSIGGYMAGVVQAMEKAVPVNASATDKLGLGVTISTSRSKDAADDADGLAQAYNNYVAVTVDADGAVTAALIDSTQGNVTFDAAGKVTADTAASVATKQELGDDYGMRAASPIGKEWFEQADAFAAYVLGKTAAQVEGIAMDESTKLTDADITGSVTISAGGLKATVLKAIANAR